MNLDLLPGEKVGIFNLGNSSTSDLFAMISGLKERKMNRFGVLKHNIFIYGENIESLIESDELSQKVLSLEQEPSVYAGTVISNIDPYQKFSRKKIIYTLQALKFKDIVESNLQNAEGALAGMKKIDKMALS